ncbi:hypothetical protein REPUB_Repub12eG0126500 [Reevesia pubescens]
MNPMCRRILLWNITTGDYKVLHDELVELPRTYCQVYCYGFGYDSINDDYKLLVRIVQAVDYSRNPPFISEEKVYSLKTNRWGRSEEIQENMYVCLCGALRWAATKERIWNMPSKVIAIDVATENYREIESLDDMELRTYNVVLVAL